MAVCLLVWCVALHRRKLNLAPTPAPSVDELPGCCRVGLPDNVPPTG